MSSRKGIGKSLGSTNSSPKEKTVNLQYGHNSEGSGYVNNTPTVEQLRRDTAGINLDSAPDGEWEVPKKSKNRAGSGAAKPWGPQSSIPNAWTQPDVQKLRMASNGGTGKAPAGNWQTQIADPKRQAGRGNSRPQPTNRGWENTYMAPPPAIPPPLQNGWNWLNRSASSQSKVSDDQGRNNTISKLPWGSTGGESSGSDLAIPPNNNDIYDDEDDVDEDDDLEDDDDSLSDGFDSDGSVKSHETRKKNNWFKAFFDNFDSLTIEQINDPLRQWHCPACKGGPGGIDWYKGLQPLITHAKTKGSKRVKLHREFAEVLEEELHKRGASMIPTGEAYGKWEGLRDTEKDHDIVWPPMIVIQNTRLEKDDNEKWIGMGNQELLDYFSTYAAVRARHSYGPQGHRGMSILIFESSVVGYMEAERLHKHFAEQGTDRESWDRRRVLFYPGGKRQLYGYMATREDLDIFNQHSQGKSRLKFEMRSYNDMVVAPLRKMNEDNQQLIYMKNKVVKVQKHSKTLEESFGMISEKLRKTMEENRIVRLRTKIQHEQYKEEMDNQEKFFNDQIEFIHRELDEKERTFEKRLQEEREKVMQSNADSGTKEDRKLRGDEIAKFIKSQDEGIEEFETEKEKLIRMHEDKKSELKRRYLEDELALEKEFDATLSLLMEHYARPSEPDTSNTSEN